MSLFGSIMNKIFHHGAKDGAAGHFDWGCRPVAAKIGAVL